MSAKRCLLATIVLVLYSAGLHRAWSAESVATADVEPVPSSTGLDQKEESESGLGEITVTAQRRTETQQNVPISVQVVGAQQIADFNLTRIDNIQLVTPGLSFDPGYGYTQTYIRGVGTTLANPGLESAVATYIDGSYIEHSLGELSDLLDIGSIEVLRGAQGTLYGRNATGGAILVNTADPTRESLIHATAEYGQFGHLLGEAIVNEPLSDSVALRVAARYSDGGGYVRNYDGYVFGGVENAQARAKLLWQPSDALKAVLSVEYRNTRDYNNALAERYPAPVCLTCALYPGSGAAPSSGFYDVQSAATSPQVTHETSEILKLSYDAGPLTYSSITSVRQFHNESTANEGLTLIPFFLFGSNYGAVTTTEDLQVSTNLAGMFNVLAGFAYVRDNAYAANLFTGDAFSDLYDTVGEFPSAYSKVDTNSYSGFAEVYITPVDRLKLTFGGRYTDDKRSIQGNVNEAGNLALAPGSPPTYSESASFTKFTPRVVVAYDLHPVNLYASWNRGFKAGGYATPAFSAPTAVKPETIDSFELGAKYESDDRRVHLNTAAFYYIYRDVQVAIIDVAQGTVTQENAADAHGYGLDLDGSFALTNYLTAIAGGEWLHARYTSYANASVYIPTYAPSGQLTGAVPGSANLAGTPLVHAPNSTASVGLMAHAPLGNDWKGDLSLLAHFTDRYYFFPDASGPIGYDAQPSYTIVNMTANVGPNSGRYTVGAYVNNLTNKHYYLIRDTNPPYGIFDSVAAPITFGIRLTANF
jgi:iron complex outermembrane recepter protein